MHMALVYYIACNFKKEKKMKGCCLLNRTIPWGLDNKKQITNILKVALY